MVLIDKTALISEVVREDVDRFVEYEQKRGMRNTTINLRLRAIRALFGYLTEMKYIAVNPMKKYPLLKIRGGNIETFSMTQLRKLLNAPDRRTFTGLRDYTLLETGLRLSEISAVLIDDIKLAEGLIFVRHTKGHMHRYVSIKAKMKDEFHRYKRTSEHANWRLYL